MQFAKSVLLFMHIILNQSSGRIYLILEYCRGGDLSVYIQNHGRVPEATAKHFMKQLGTMVCMLEILLFKLVLMCFHAVCCRDFD